MYIYIYFYVLFCYEYYLWNDEYFQYFRYTRLYELMLYLCNALSIVIHKNCVINFHYNAISIIRIEISDT